MTDQEIGAMDPESNAVLRPSSKFLATPLGLHARQSAAGPYRHDTD